MTMRELASLCSRPGLIGGEMPLTCSVSGDTRRKWTWSKGEGHGGNLDSLGTMGGGNRSETAGMGTCIHRVRDILFHMEANLVGGNRTEHLWGRVDPLMIVSHVLKGGGTCWHLCARPMTNNPSPQEAELTHTHTHTYVKKNNTNRQYS